MRKTKIVCTIGPASESPEMIEKLALAGMNVARLNFSHGSHEEHKRRIETIRKVRKKLGLPIAILLDTKGPEFRIKTFKGGKITLQAGDTFTFRGKDVEGDQQGVSVNFEGLAKDVKPGDHILVCNGLMDFEVKKIDGVDVICETLTDGNLSDRKSMNFPGKIMSTEFLSEQDKADILFGIENDVDFIACSFVSRAEDLKAVHAFLNEHGCPDMELIAKIENQPGIDNIEEICEQCSGIMIGRGDMGVEIAPEKLPAVQKSLITKCRLLGKRVITATEMLESMITSPRPTRAEVSDVANAVYDGTSAVMLSGETAAGKYPEQAVRMMASIAHSTEQEINYKKRFHNYSFEMKNNVDCISHAVCGMAIDVDAKAIAVCSISGITVMMVSRFRCPVDIIGITTNEKSYRRLALSWAVTPVLCEKFDSTDVLFYFAQKTAEEIMDLSDGDNVVLTGGMINGTSGNTNLIKIATVGKNG
ncbi:MAG: pyruvate kinase [Lachnospiraceae bacterium]|nr:pyruvate kinase [Lachnospiraceae bacterium]